eukprot:CAMPEP_0114341214 /NCGR_PEP_ID=MMETSP0101-20121206/8894_1 /TAXON_ID=38822 ORGANISM="Pteridomonas danica, Strain PT" /NCGR_SAMPLE_ID=MMETSP0101 /ASSEMBLY_ACC=CAM_ASM_000211 /LENGTH=431 /DNA_ID=CAMNT_0001474735 /DNA_START=1322 /DNA_END=2615 /DNA_ORIENTATION=+
MHQQKDHNPLTTTAENIMNPNPNPDWIPVDLNPVNENNFTTTPTIVNENDDDMKDKKKCLLYCPKIYKPTKAKSWLHNHNKTTENNNNNNEHEQETDSTMTRTLWQQIGSDHEIKEIQTDDDDHSLNQMMSHLVMSSQNEMDENHHNEMNHDNHDDLFMNINDEEYIKSNQHKDSMVQDLSDSNRIDNNNNSSSMGRLLIYSQDSCVVLILIKESSDDIPFIQNESNPKNELASPLSPSSSPPPSSIQKNNSLQISKLLQELPGRPSVGIDGVRLIYYNKACHSAMALSSTADVNASSSSSSSRSTPSSSSSQTKQHIYENVMHWDDLVLQITSKLTAIQMKAISHMHTSMNQRMSAQVIETPTTMVLHVNGGSSISSVMNDINNTNTTNKHQGGGGGQRNDDDNDDDGHHGKDNSTPSKTGGSKHSHSEW